jgi:hypothetical protein
MTRRLNKYVLVFQPVEPVLGAFLSTGGLVISTDEILKEEKLDFLQQLWPNLPSLIFPYQANGTWISLISVSFLLDVLALSPVTTDVGATEIKTDMT